MSEHSVCDDPECRLHGIAASLARQSAFYAENDRTVVAGPDEGPPHIPWDEFASDHPDHSDENDVDPCRTCGRADVIDGPSPAAHWATSDSDIVAAWTCSDACSDALEALRRPDGTLPPT